MCGTGTLRVKGNRNGLQISMQHAQDIAQVSAWEYAVSLGFSFGTAIAMSPRQGASP